MCRYFIDNNIDPDNIVKNTFSHYEEKYDYLIQGTAEYMSIDKSERKSSSRRCDCEKLIYTLFSLNYLGNT